MDLMRSIGGNYLVIAFGNITKKKLFKMGMCKNHWEHLERRKPLL
jgi:hypothetical protein